MHYIIVVAYELRIGQLQTNDLIVIAYTSSRISMKIGHILSLFTFVSNN